MACVIAWRLERMKDDESEVLKAFLIRLSGRQMKRSRPVTTSARLDGLRILFVMVDVLDQYSSTDIHRLAQPLLDYLSHRKMCRYAWAKPVPANKVYFSSVS